ncbi:MAG: cell wall-binding repeat-containing protein [Peptoniphilaceae bacterium]|nr:cell wall-binding repeat-containing protein [Peptoniphilaceae bacterium]MDY6085753.1 cell wall-binding repeat-containing protein [Peptoniphilaceae bacterium]
MSPRRQRWIGSVIAGLLFTLVIAMGMTKPACAVDANYAYIKMEGHYATADRQNVLNRLNEIRQEAVNHGYVKTYVPLSWSPALENIAQTRAAETAVFFEHQRLDGAKIWMSENHASENLAFSAEDDAMLEAVEQWYEEKAYYDADPEDSRAGHYRNLIDPEFTSTGLASFAPAHQVDERFFTYYYTALALGRQVDTSAQALQGDNPTVAVGPQFVQKLSIKSAPQSLKVGESEGMVVTATVTTQEAWAAQNALTADIAKGQFTSSNPNVATVDEAGLVRAVAPGQATISLAAAGKTASVTLVVEGKSTDSPSNANPTQPSTPAKVLGGGRLSGRDRFAVAANVSSQFFEDADAVLLVNYLAYGDAISGANLSQGKAPILYTTAQTLPAATKAELLRMQPKTVYLLGGTQSIQAAVEQQVHAVVSGAPVKRLSGADRFAVNVTTLGQPADVAHLVIANGNDYPDALTGTPLAQSKGAKLLLTKPQAIPAATEAALRQMKQLRSITVVGGPKSVSDAVLARLQQLTGVKPVRLTGKDRYTLSAQVAQNAFTKPAVVLTTSGEGFADALVAAPLSQNLKAPIVLVRAASVHPDVLHYLRTTTSLKTNYVIGGPQSITPAVFDQVIDAAQ